MQPFALNITQPTDFGTLYPSRSSRRSRRSRTATASVHMDGARFANAVAASAARRPRLTWRAGVDVLSFGATKNGAINAEALIVFDEALAARCRS